MSGLDSKIISAAGIVKNTSGKFFVFYRGEPFNDLTFPKGKLKLNETLEECAIREVLEETGLKVKIIKKIGIHTYNFEDWANPDNIFTKDVHYFLCEPISGFKLDVRADLKDNVISHDWVSKKDILNTLKKKNYTDLYNIFAYAK